MVGIERGKHARRRQHVGLGERIEQRRLPRVRIAHQRHRGHRNRFAPLPLLRPDAAHIFDLLLDVPDAAVDFSPVGFQLRFARSAGADAAAQLRHFHAASRQPRQHVFQLRQFHLQLAFTSARVPRKNIENQLRPIDDAGVDDALDIALLRRREIVIEENDIRGNRSGTRPQSPPACPCRSAWRDRAGRGAA